jgi:hypothetical protein
MTFLSSDLPRPEKWTGTVRAGWAIEEIALRPEVEQVGEAEAP